MTPTICSGQPILRVHHMEKTTTRLYGHTDYQTHRQTDKPDTHIYKGKTKIPYGLHTIPYDPFYDARTAICEPNSYGTCSWRCKCDTVFKCSSAFIYNIFWQFLFKINVRLFIFLTFFSIKCYKETFVKAYFQQFPEILLQINVRKGWFLALFLKFCYK